MKPVRVPFPWLSAAGAVLILGWQFLLRHPQLVDGIGWAERLMRERYLAFGALALLLVVIFELRRYLRAAARNREQMQRYRDQIDELFDAKRALGTRARTFSDHADKLKMFISERLLEYIEYDEKFLHFKNIASEVRHNGVISYDRAQTALQNAADHCPADEAEACREAADSLLYLWDLLDLSTTDNIALYVTNRIYDCEEHYFQAQLNPAEAAAAPVQPTFRMRQALVRALAPIVENPDALAALRNGGDSSRYVDEQFSVVVQGDGELLGKANHMVLLIENLLNNALFYAKQKAPRQTHNPVTIYLALISGDVLLRVYNRGPHIPDDEKDRIYQLGFSSRRIREHHGKGLGLYFVNEITRGFEGRIGFENIDNRSDQVSLSIKLGNGELQREQIGIVDVAGKPMCRLDGEQVARRHEWSYNAPIVSVEVSSQAVGKPQVISDLADGGDSQYIDKADPQRAYWQVDITNRKRSSRLRFVPLDVRGVEFSLAFASASARLENQD